MKKQCPSYLGYSVDEFGIVYSHRRRGTRVLGKHGGTTTDIDFYHNYILSQFISKKGYRTVNISIDGKKPRPIGVHQLVADAFIGKRQGKDVVRHLDGDASNNNFNNLAYGTHFENASDRISHGRYFSGESHPNAKITNQQALEIRTLRQAGTLIKNLAKSYSVSISTIEGIVYEKTYKSIEFKRLEANK